MFVDEIISDWRRTLKEVSDNPGLGIIDLINLKITKGYIYQTENK